MDSLSELVDPSVPSSSSGWSTTQAKNTEAEEFNPEQSLSAGRSYKGVSSMRKENVVLEYVPRQTPQPGGTSTVGLWEEAVAKYRKTADLNCDQERMLSELPRTIDSRFEYFLAEWEEFRNPPKSGKLVDKLKEKLSHTIKALHEKIPLMDVVIGYPAQAVFNLKS